MSNILLVYWRKYFDDGHDGKSRRERLEDQVLAKVDVPRTSAGMFLILRRMRIPLIVLITIFAVSVMGLSLVPGETADGEPTRMGLFDSFYFMSYTATTIGFGEIPHAFTPEQRLWVTFTIYLAVIGWAYAIGSLLSLTQDREFRRALARRHFVRKVERLREPFLLLIGLGSSGRTLARSLDEIGQRFVVVDKDESAIASLELESFRADAPGLVGDARDAGRLAIAGLAHLQCEGVLAMTGDDEANLAAAMSTSLLRPDLPVIARTVSRPIEQRMQAFGSPEVVNPFDRFGDHLRILLRAPSAYRLMIWLTSAPGTELPERYDALPRGRWVVCGYGRFGHEITSDLRAEGLEVTVIERAVAEEGDEARFSGGPSSVMKALPDAVEGAAGFVAATDSDTANLNLVEAAHRVNPDLFLVARQNRSTNRALYDAVGVDFLLVPAEVIAHETLARLASPVLMRFLPKVPRQSEEWSAELLDRLVAMGGTRMQRLWRVSLTEDGAPALTEWLASGDARLGDLLRNPGDRDARIDAVPLLLLREDEVVLAPDDDFMLATGDEMLVVGRPGARRALETTLISPATAAYVVRDRFEPSGWLWRRMSRGRRDREPVG